MLYLRMGFSCSVRALQKMLARGHGGGQSDHKFRYLPIIIGFSVSFGGLGPPHFEVNQYSANIPLLSK